MINERLQQLRESHHYTKKRLGEMLNMSPEGYGYYESGKRKPSPEVIADLAKHYKVSTDYLLGLTDDPTPPNSDPLPSKNSFLNEDGSAYIYVLGRDGDNKRILVPAEKVDMVRKLLEAVLPELDENDDNPDI